MILPHQKIAIPGIPRAGVRILVAIDDAKNGRRQHAKSGNVDIPWVRMRFLDFQ